MFSKFAEAVQTESDKGEDLAKFFPPLMFLIRDNQLKLPPAYSCLSRDLFVVFTLIVPII